MNAISHALATESGYQIIKLRLQELEDGARRWLQIAGA